MYASILLQITILVHFALPQTGTGTLTGRLLSIDGTPQSGMRIALIAATANSQANLRAIMSLAQTDRSGQYKLESIPPGKYFVMAGPLDSPSYYPGTSSSTNAIAIIITAGTTTPALDFTFVPSGGIQRMQNTDSAGRFFGSVYDGAGVPIPNITVVLTSNAPSAESFLTSTDRAGTFDISGLSAGEYSLKILSSVNSGFQSLGYEQITHPITVRSNQGVEISIRLRLAMRSRSILVGRPDQYSLFSESLTVPPGGQISTSANALSLDSGESLLDPRTAASRNGEIDLEVTFSNTGRVFSARIIDPAADPNLARIAVEGVRDWRLSRLPAIGRPWSSLKTSVAVYPPHSN